MDNQVPFLRPELVRVVATIDNREIHGHFTYLDERSFDVALDSHPDFQTGFTTPAFAMMSNVPKIKYGIISKDCLASARCCLIELEKSVRILDENYEEIASEYKRIVNAIPTEEKYADGISHEEFLKARQILRQKIRKQEIGNTLYSLEISKLQKREKISQDRAIAIELAFSDFLEKRFGLIGVDFREHFIKKIEEGKLHHTTTGLES